MHFPPTFLQKPPPAFSMVHLLHRLYGVDAPDLVHPADLYKVDVDQMAN